MGIANLWAHLKAAAPERVPFPKFLADFIEAHGRTPRIAIDAYILIHHVAGTAVESDDLVVRSFVSKLLYLTQHNVSYVVVFDGRYKPDKMRNTTLVNVEEYASLLEDYQSAPPLSYLEEIPLIESIKDTLTGLSIDFVQAPGEAEAECAWLQRLGVVDFVMTDDSDALVFGATRVLKAFRRLVEELPSKRSTTSYFVTPWLMDEITTTTGLDRRRLVLVATLGGGDYSLGMDRIGITSAVHIAQCGTQFAAYYTREKLKVEKKLRRHSHPLPDFAAMFENCFVKGDGPRLPQECIQLVKHFLEVLNDCVKERPRDIFKEHKLFPQRIWIDEKYALLYFFPFTSKTPYKFETGRLSNGQPPLFVPPSFSYNKRHLVARLLDREDLKIAREKLADDTTLLMIKYNEDGDYVWLPRALVRLVVPEAVKTFDRTQEWKLRSPKRSPRKAVPKQKTTLDALGSFPASPTKRKANDEQPPPKYVSTRSPRKSPVKAAGQALVTAFFQNKVPRLSKPPRLEHQDTFEGRGETVGASLEERAGLGPDFEDVLIEEISRSMFEESPELPTKRRPRATAHDSSRHAPDTLDVLLDSVDSD